ncbi:MAG TPA: hypothetical protein VF534_30380 [Paraburkholderia sp.]
MGTYAQGNPHWVAALLAQRWLPPVARAALVMTIRVAGIERSSGHAGFQ